LHEDSYEDVFTSYRRYYECIYTEVLDRLMHFYSQANMIDDMLTHAHYALLIDPYNESAIKAIVDGHYRQGNTAGAIRKLDHFQALLREELGVEPGAALLALRKQIAQLG
jgi:DNA-binding SARP family transcriptional activator